jgi:DNA-binding response OmpR family regulator
MKILVVDESPRFADLLKERFPAQMQQTCASSATTSVDVQTDYAGALEMLRTNALYDVVILDSTPKSQPANLALDILRKLKGSLTVAIVLATYDTVPNCVDCMRAGACDYLPKTALPFAEILDALIASIDRALKERTPELDLDIDFVRLHFRDLAKKHGGQWIAVAQGTLITFATTYETLQSQLLMTPPLAPAKIWRMPPFGPEIEQ